MHARPETLLLYALGASTGVDAAVDAHLRRCEACRDRVDLLLTARFAADEPEAGAATDSGPFRAAAAAAKTFATPAPPERLGFVTTRDGLLIGIFRRGDAPGGFLLDALDFAGRSVKIGGIPCAIDRFGRFQLAEGPAEVLAKRLGAGEEPAIEAR